MNLYSGVDDIVYTITINVLALNVQYQDTQICMISDNTARQFLSQQLHLHQFCMLKQCSFTVYAKLCTELFTVVYFLAANQPQRDCHCCT